MSKFFGYILKQTKEIAIETAIEITDDIMLQTKDKLKNYVSDKTQNLMNKKETPEKSKEIFSLPNVQQREREVPKIFINKSEESSDSAEDEYMDVFRSKLVNGKISEMSKYFLKLKRDEYQISNQRANELESIVLEKLKE